MLIDNAWFGSSGCGIGRVTDALLQRVDVPSQRLRGGVMGNPGIVEPRLRT